MRSPLFLCLLLVCNTASALEIEQIEGLSIYGKTTLRYESDTGSPLRNDRHRGRISQWLGWRYELLEQWSIENRWRTGTRRNQHSPTVTVLRLDDNRFGQRSVVADLYQVAFKGDALSFQAGRVLPAFWFNTDYYWDNDVTNLGADIAWTREATGGDWILRGGVYKLPDGMVNFNGELYGLQLQHDRAAPALGESAKLRAAGGLYYMAGSPDAEFLRNGDGDREYLIGVASLRYASKLASKPLTAGFDLIYNFQNYDAADPDPVTSTFADDRLAAGFALSWGQNSEQGNLRLRYNYAYVEKLAVNGAYSADTIARFDTSNYQGHDFRAIYSLHKNVTTMLRLMISEQVNGIDENVRFRWDTGLRF